MITYNFQILPRFYLQEPDLTIRPLPPISGEATSRATSATSKLPLVTLALAAALALAAVLSAGRGPRLSFHSFQLGNMGNDGKVGQLPI